MPGRLLSAPKHAYTKKLIAPFRHRPRHERFELIRGSAFAGKTAGIRAGPARWNSSAGPYGEGGSVMGGTLGYAGRQDSRIAASHTEAAIGERRPLDRAFHRSKRQSQRPHSGRRAGACRAWRPTHRQGNGSPTRCLIQVDA